MDSWWNDIVLKLLFMKFTQFCIGKHSITTFSWTNSSKNLGKINRLLFVLDTEWHDTVFLQYVCQYGKRTMKCIRQWVFRQGVSRCKEDNLPYFGKFAKRDPKISIIYQLLYNTCVYGHWVQMTWYMKQSTIQMSLLNSKSNYSGGSRISCRGAWTS